MICPKCRREIPPQDVNVASDIAFCRSCNLPSKLSDLVHHDQFLSFDVSHPPKGAWRHDDGSGMVIGASHRSIGGALAALGICLFWNGIVSVFVLLALSSTLSHFHVNTPAWFPAPKMNGESVSIGMTLFLWLFLTPFMLIGLFMISTVLNCLGGRTEVVLRQTDGAVFTGIGPLGWRRRFNPGEAKAVRVQEKLASYRNDNAMRSNEIVIELKDGREIKFGSSLKQERQKFVATALSHALLG